MAAALLSAAVSTNAQDLSDTTRTEVLEASVVKGVTVSKDAPFAVANIDYKEINRELDKYTRAFDVIDVLYQSLRTSLNIYNTYETISDRVGDYKEMLDDFNRKCLERGDIVSTDTQIIAINVRAIAKIADEGDNLYRSVCDLVLYATGAAACSTSDLLLILTNINNSLDNIRKHLNQAYFETWKYIQVRIGYWKRQVYRAKTMQEIVNDAFGRWRISGYLGY